MTATANRPAVMHCTRCAHVAHDGSACTAFHIAGQRACTCTGTYSGSIEAYDIDSSMIERYGSQWRDTMALEIERGFRSRAVDLIKSSLRDCETWSKAGVNTDRFARLLRGLLWLVRD